MIDIGVTGLVKSFDLEKKILDGHLSDRYR